MQKTVAAVFVLVALAASAWWLLRPSDGPHVGDADTGAGSADLAPGRVDAAAGGRDGAGRVDAAVLAAGRRRPEQAGVGGVSLRVAAARDQAPVVDATISLRGTGHAGEVVDLVMRTDAKGLASFAQVPAGSGYTLRVDAAKAGVGLRPDVEVRASGITDLGAVLVGEGLPIRGRVEDDDGRPVAGADVRAVVAQDNPMEFMANFVEFLTNFAREPSPLARTVSGADGTFVLEAVPVGVVTVRATSPGRKLATARVEVSPTKPPTDVTLRLESGASIVGVVVGEGGTPLVGATMAWMQMNDGSFNMMGKRVFTTTEAGGRFEVVVEPGTKGWRAAIDADRYPVTVSASFSAGTRDVRIVLERGADLELTLLTEGDRRPVVGATVLLAIGEFGGGSEDDDDSGGAMPSAVTDGNGVVRLSGRPGKVSGVMAFVPGHGMLMADSGGEMGEAMGLQGDLPKELAAGVLARTTLTIRSLLEVTGVVSAADGSPIPNCRVAPVGLFGGAGAERGSAEVLTDAAGRYRVALSSGWGGQGGMLSFQLDGYASLTRFLQVSVEDRTAGRKLVNVTLRRAATLRGRVVDAAGKPVAGARVGVEGAVGAEMFGMLGIGGAPHATTAADGSYLLEGINPSGSRSGFNLFGPDEASEEAEPSAEAKTQLEVVASGFVGGQSDPVRVTEGAVVDVPVIRLSRGATLVGQVLRADGRPAAAAKVEVSLQPTERTSPRMRLDATGGFSMGDTRTLVADAEGRFTVEACEVGKAIVVGQSPGAAQSRATVTIAPAEGRVEVKVVLRAAGHVSGLVLDPDGRPLRGARAEVTGSLLDLEGDEAYVASLTATTGADGRFTLEGLPDGRITISVSAASMQRASVVARVGGTIEVRLVRRSGEQTARLTEITTEIAEVSLKFVQATDSTERAALQQRLMDLSREQAELKAAVGDAPIPSPTTVQCGEGKCG